MIRRLAANIKPTKPEDRAVSQDVQSDADGIPISTLTIGPEGGRLVLGTIDLPDNGSMTVTVRVTPVDAAGNRTANPAVATRTFSGTDTTAPDTPEAPEILDLEDEEPI